ncbi:glycoside hydrolase [Lindgomyces ingoldianus]|uniref:Glycoside hydrolase n=1 Tax=Lindgomyces ingoldianus TaxID=673940 RepID=A0ACB6RCN5_9PLEO|nr:glycoside hydrolase [Lindgomyces ingoldianus]KAF2476999.1 glycoside hydrolase [Lindgomyces ingoldianus]
MRFTTLSVALATSSLSIAAPAPAANYDHGNDHARKPEGLNALARKAGLLYFGTAIDNPSLNNTKYLSIAYNTSEFGQVTPANGQKWMYIEPSRNVFNYAMGDAIIKPAIQNHQMRRCHNLLWHSQLPDWLTSKNYTKSELIGILENHIKHEANYYKNECYAWDVVNEAFNDDGTYRNDLWLWTIGPEYLELAFKFAKKYVGRGTKLYYNDYNVERVNNKSMAIASMVKSFQAKDIPIDGLGFQAHFTTGKAPSYDEVKASMKQFTDLGLEVAITELDVRTTLPDSDEKQAQQAKDYAATVKACKDTEDCVGVTVWDFWDPLSWVPDVFSGQGVPCLWSANYTKKPAYYAVAEVLRD